MRIAVDVSPLSHPRTGIGNYIRGMLAGLVAAAGPDDELVAFAPTSLPGKRRIRAALAGLPLDLRLVFLPFAHEWRTAWSRLGRPGVERFLGPIDVLHFSDWMYPPQRSGLRVTTIHDLVPLRFPEWVTPRTRRMHGAKYRHAARTCGLVVVNSGFTGNDVAELLGIEQERIRVAYPGIDPRFRPNGPTADLGAPYILSVATLEPRKNLGTLVAAIQILRRSRPEVELAVAGPAGWGHQPRESEGVRLLGFVSDDELARLYRGAAAAAYPSRFEGFGIPIVEAMASGVPAVASSHPSLDEASGDAAVRADPESPAALAAALERALDDPAPLVERGLAHARRFTWEAGGAAILAGYRTHLGRG